MNKILNNRHALFVCLFLTAVTLAVFWQVKNHEFISFDDGDYVTNNRYVQAGFTVKGVAWAFNETHVHNWHPLTWLSHMSDCQIFGLRPGLHHLMNLFFHVANTLLLFLILHRTTRALWKSAFVAAVFALHPLHVESVAWASERKDVLSTFFWMLTMGAYVFYVEKREPKRYLLTLFFFTLGLMAKPMLVTLPFVLLLMDYWPLGRIDAVDSNVHAGAQIPKPENRAKKRQKSRKQTNTDTVRTKEPAKAGDLWSGIRSLIQEKIPFIIIAAIFCFVTFYAQFGVVKPMELFPLEARIANALISYVIYIGKMLWPVNLSIFYPYERFTLLSWQTVSALLLLLVATFLIIRASKRSPYLIVGWLWYLGTLVPVIGLVQVGLQSMADRYTYVPLIGVFIMIAWGVPSLYNHRRYRQSVLAFVAVGILSVLIVMTYMQVKYWRNSIILYEHATKVTSENNWAYYNLGLSLMQSGRNSDALPYLQEAIRIKPNDYQAILNIGVISAERGNIHEAASHFEKVLQMKPDYDEAHINLATVFLREGNLGRALHHSQEALRIAPDKPEALFLLGKVFFKKGDIDDALSYYTKALSVKPDYAEAHNNIGIAFAQKGKFNEAVYHFREALLINPNYKEAYKNLKVALSHQQVKDNPIKSKLPVP